MLRGCQIASCEAKQKELEGVCDPINMMYCKANSIKKELNKQEDEKDSRPPPKPGERGGERPELDKKAKPSEHEQHERDTLNWL
eukprot:15425305-Alexandrium_andersonii.AAC.1